MPEQRAVAREDRHDHAEAAVHQPVAVLARAAWRAASGGLRGPTGSGSLALATSEARDEEASSRRPRTWDRRAIPSAARRPSATRSRDGGRGPPPGTAGWRGPPRRGWRGCAPPAGSGSGGRRTARGRSAGRSRRGASGGSAALRCLRPPRRRAAADGTGEDLLQPLLRVLIEIEEAPPAARWRAERRIAGEGVLQAPCGRSAGR